MTEPNDRVFFHVQGYEPQGTGWYFWSDSTRKVKIGWWETEEAARWWMKEYDKNVASRKEWDDGREDY